MENCLLLSNSLISSILTLLILVQEKEQTSSLGGSLPKVKPKSNDFAANKLCNPHEERGLAEIEQLVKQKTFTRPVIFLYFSGFLCLK